MSSSISTFTPPRHTGDLRGQTKDNEIFEEVSLGDGPINAAYNAIDKITGLCDELWITLSIR